MAFHMREATADDVPALCDVFFDAFSEDPISSRIFPRSSALAQAEILDTFTHSVAEPGVHVFVMAEDLSDSASEAERRNAVLGYVEWVAPRTEPYTPPPPAPSTEGSQKVAALAQQFFEVMMRKQREHMAGTPHWHLAFIGVRRRAQGRGVARPLIQWGVDRADADGVEAYVQSSPMAAARYRRYGFEDFDSHHFALAGDYHEVFLKRKPKQQDQRQQQQQLPSSTVKDTIDTKDAKETKVTSSVEGRKGMTESLQTSHLFSTSGGTREGKSLDRFDHPPSAIAQVG
ncbi:acyl-CoA N-acyltransferase [Apiospora kogelbergensis]|uniref:acyl-CoA N-acyltransferase n=1 Tax=Apiospora kogelbergensis TaxID=1337665 RepID=UPI00312CCE50